MLDVTRADALWIATGMGATRNEQLAEYYLKAAGIAAVWIDTDGHVGAADVVRLDPEPGQLAYCCARGAHFVLAYRLCLWRQEQGFFPDQAAVAAKLEQLAEEGGVGITPHGTAILRAFEAVATVNRALDAMTAGGQMREFNRAFKAARKVDASLRYHDDLHSRKAAMLEAIAMGKELLK
jgi:hypothetical protein